MTSHRRFPGEVVLLCVSELAVVWLCGTTIAEKARTDAGPGPASVWQAPVAWFRDGDGAEETSGFGRLAGKPE